MNLNALKSLVAIHDSRSFGEAARRTGYTQSAVSMQIKGLETALGVTLFDRSVRPPRLTPVAIALIEPAREILERVESLERRVADHAGLEGRLELGVVPTAALSLLPGAMDALARRYPQLDVRVTSGLTASLVAGVAEGSLVAALVTGSDDLPTGLVAETIMAERLAIVAAGAHRGPLELATLAWRPLIRFDRRVGVGRIIQDFLDHKGLEPETHVELDSIEAILALVDRDLGLAIVPERSLTPAQRRSLTVAPLSDHEARRELVLVCAERRRDEPLLAAALEAFRSAARQG